MRAQLLGDPSGTSFQRFSRNFFLIKSRSLDQMTHVLIKDTLNHDLTKN